MKFPQAFIELKIHARSLVFFYDCTSTYILWSVLGVRSNFFVNLMVVITGLEKASVPLVGWRYSVTRIVNTGAF